MASEVERISITKMMKKGTDTGRSRNTEDIYASDKRIPERAVFSYKSNRSNKNNKTNNSDILDKYYSSMRRVVSK